MCLGINRRMGSGILVSLVAGEGALRLRSAGSKIQGSDFWFEGLLAASANDQGWFVCVLSG